MLRVQIALFLVAMILSVDFVEASPGGFEHSRHTAWRADDDAPTNIQAMAQTPDGFLWLGSGTGLYRFDGLSFERIRLVGENRGESLQVASIAAAPNGDVWVGYDWGGIARYHAGRLERINPGMPSKLAVYLAVTPDGALWARADGDKRTRLFRYSDGRWEGVGPQWNMPDGMNASAMLVATDGSLYLLCPDGLRRLRPGSRRFELTPLDCGEGATIAEDPRGRIWLANERQLVRIAFGEGKVGPSTPIATTNIYRRLVFDREGVAWLGGSEDGIQMLVPDATGDRYSRAEINLGAANGLSANITLSLLRDREGNVWVGTLGGLDRFSFSRSVTPIGLPISYNIDTFRGSTGETYLISNNDIFVVAKAGLRKVSSLPNVSIVCGDQGGLIVATSGGVYAIDKGGPHWIDAPGLSQGSSDGGVRSCTQDSKGRLILSIARKPLYRRDGSRWEALAPALTTTPVGALALLHEQPGSILATYPLRQILRISDKGVEVAWKPEHDGLGFIKTLYQSDNCTLVGAQNGLGCLKNGRMRVLSAALYPELTNVTGITRSGDGSTWLVTLSGILRVRSDALDAALVSPGRKLAFQRFGAEQGLRGETMMLNPRDIAADRFGRLWIFTNKGLVSIDTNRLDTAFVPPRVVIKAVRAGDVLYAATGPIRLPVGTRAIQVDYTSTALADPKGTRFHYLLEGVDTSWTEAGQRRQAIYTNLSPGRYRFRVAAASSAGAASRADAVIDIEIAPSFTQTWAFYVLCGVLLLALAWLILRWRIHAVASRMSERLQARLDERERIARELHDTLLQAVNGLLLRFQGVASRPPPDAVRHELESALDRAEDLIIEGRDRVRQLRANEGNCDLEEILALALAEPGIGSELCVKIERAGRVRPVPVLVGQELGAIAAEAFTNAISHSGATLFTLTMIFGSRALELDLVDDGCGIPQEVAEAGSRTGHFGLVGMRERGARLGGKVELRPHRPHGTRIHVTIPANKAYASYGRWPRLRRLLLLGNRR